jgi:hypothetical protein
VGLGGGGGKGGEGSPKRPTDASLILRARKYRIDLITARKVRLKGKNEAVSVHEVFDDYAAELSMANVSRRSRAIRRDLGRGKSRHANRDL